MDELITKVEQWAKDKGLDQADSSKKMLKTIEEIGEVAASLARKDEHGLRDGIGDVVVTLIILAMQNDMDLYECLNQAYNEIKGRTGKMVDGVFVKSSDLEDSDESKITDEQAWNKVAEAYPESAQSLRNTLDNAVFGKTGEHQKPVVPKFVAEWIEQAKKERQSLYEAMYNIESSTYYHKYDNATYQWMFEGALHDEHQELFAEAYMHGYEVEKGPLWAIKNADGNYLTKCALWGKDGVNYSFECNPSYRLLFTDKATADAAALLVNGTVEEVAEG